MPRLEVGDLVELNAAGKMRGWLDRAKDAIGIVIKLHEPKSPYDIKSGTAEVHWTGLPPLPMWNRYNRLETRVIPQNCLKKVRKRKQK